MSPDWQTRVRAAETNATRLMADGEPLAAAEALAEKASLEAAIRRYDLAVVTLGECAALAQAANAPGPRAEYLHAQGLLLARVPGREGEASQAFKVSVALARVANDAALEVRGLQRQAEFDLNRRDVAGAVSRLDVAVARATEAKLDEVLPALLRVRAVYLQAQGRMGAALENLETAVRHLEGMAERDEHLLLQLRLERRVLADLVAGGRRPESFEAIAAAAEAAGAADVALDIQLQAGAEHIRDGDIVAGHALAEAAKQAALETNDAYRYTLACMLLGEAKERLGDRAGVIGVLLGCKITLEQQVGPEAGQGVKAILQSLEQRWGAAGVGAALAEHRARMQSTPVGNR